MQEMERTLGSTICRYKKTSLNFSSLQTVIGWIIHEKNKKFKGLASMYVTGTELLTHIDKSITNHNDDNCRL